MIKKENILLWKRKEKPITNSHIEPIEFSHEIVQEMFKLNIFIHGFNHYNFNYNSPITRVLECKSIKGGPWEKP